MFPISELLSSYTQTSCSKDEHHKTFLIDTSVTGLTSFHPFHLGVLSQSTTNTQIILLNTIMPVSKVIIGDLWVAGNEITAEVDLIVGMLEETAIACTRNKVDGKGEDEGTASKALVNTPGRKSLW